MEVEKPLVGTRGPGHPRNHVMCSSEDKRSQHTTWLNNPQACCIQILEWRHLLHSLQVETIQLIRVATLDVPTVTVEFNKG